ncbi:hypothetical protein [Plantibacter sp. ME-Dv--P-095]|uniref:hypothetical protein n=1 Tax=Plantibacter sp. ME-Dv--P-095 TaxID=3040299 RepID=UPI00254CA5C8|nr:hypothetical protein [Plantibacter sp. ME-Dv--P-095]
MKLKKTLSAFGLIAITASGVLTGPAAASAVSPEVTVADTTSAQLTGQFVLKNSASSYYWTSYPASFGFISRGFKTLEETLEVAPPLTVPAVGTTGKIQFEGLCVPSANEYRPVFLTSCDAAFTDGMYVEADGTIRNQVGRRLDMIQGTFEWRSVAEGGEAYEDRLVMSQMAPVEEPAASISSPTLQPGASAQVTATFNAAAGGQRIDIDHPADTTITAVDDSAFTLNSQGMTGTLPSGTTSVTFTLTADQDAPIGTARGGQIAYGANRTKLADFTANIEAPPVAPAVEIDSVTVQQGDSVDVDVEFNESVSGQVDIILPQGLAPTGAAPSGFTWNSSIKGFRGTVTDANRVFTMDLTAAADAAVGTFNGAVRGSGLEQGWSATITAAPIAPAVTIESVNVQQGQSVGVDVEFNASVSGQVEIVVPAGLAPTGNAPAGFTWLPSINGFSGTVTNANRAFTMNLTAAADAAVGTFDGVVRGAGLNQPWSATITAAPVAPAVTVESVTVQQGQSVGVDVEFNATASGLTDILLPQGLAPTGAAPTGFTWMPGIGGFRGTVSDANRVFTMNLTAAADAAVGTFDGVVRGSHLEQPWSATITAAPIPPAVTIPTPTLRQGQSVQVEATFNTAAGGKRIDVYHPAGTKITAVQNSAFTIDALGMGGTLPVGTTSLKFTLTANTDAPIGAATGGKVTYGSGHTKIADFTAMIEAAPIAPAVTIKSVTVQQGESVDVPVIFNAGVNGLVGIIVPQGLSPVGNAPAGFFWSEGVHGFTGTVTDANRAITLHLAAAPDAAVGTFDGAVTGGGLVDVPWSATITASTPIPDEPIVLVSPEIGAVLEPGAPVFSGTGQAGAKIQVYSASQQLMGETEVESDGTWSLTWSSSLTPGHYSGGTVRQYVGDKPYTSVPYDFTVKAAEVAPLVVTSPQIGETIEEATPVFTGTAQPGARVEIRGGWGDLLGSVDSVASNGQWSITWNKTVVPGRYAGGTVKQFVDGVERGKFVYDFTVESAEVAPLVVTAPKVGATIEETKPVFTGTAQPGAKVEIRGASGSLLGSVDSVASNGQWSITWNKTVVPGHYSGGTVKQFVGGVERGKFVYDFTIGNTTVAPLLVTSPKVGETTHETTPVFTGSAQPGAKVEIRGASGTILGSVESVASNGQWSITWNKTVLPARYSGGTVKQFVNGEERGKFIYDFTIVPSQLVVSSPKIGETISGTRPVFTGTAIPNAEIQIRGAWGTDLGHTAANEHGEWTITWPSDYKPARYSGGTVTESVNGKVIGSFTYDFILTK